MFTQHSLLDSCAGNIRTLNKLYNSTRYFCYHFQIKIAIEPGAFHYNGVNDKGLTMRIRSTTDPVSGQGASLGDLSVTDFDTVQRERF